MRRRGLIGLGALALGLFLLGAAWVLVTGLLARAQLNTVKGELPKLRHAIATGDLGTARRLGSDIEHHTRLARSLTSGPAWSVAAALPLVGTPLDTSRTMAVQVDRIGRGSLPAVLRLAGDISRATSTSTSSVDLTKLADSRTVLGTATRTTRSAVAAIRATSPSWLSSVSAARTSLLADLQQIDDQLSGAQRAIRIAVPMLGDTAPQHYFIGFLNEAESRGLGGVPGQFAIATADHGRITFSRFGTDDDLAGARADVDLGADFTARYKQDDPTGLFQNSDVSPDFRDAARIWASMWENKTGEHIDGAIAIDPTALSYLLAVAGPTALPDGTMLTSRDVVAFTEQKQYAQFDAYTPAGVAARKAYLVAIARAVSARLVEGAAPSRLVRALSRAAQERRLMVWSARPDVESQLVASGWAGAVAPPSGSPVSGFVITNASGGKLDYYVQRAMTYTRTGCDAGGQTYATFTIHSTAPTSGLPAYVTTRKDTPPAGARAGGEQLIVTYYADRGAALAGMTLDDAPVIVAPAREDGLIAASISVELPAGGTRTITATTVGPAMHAGVTILRQPGAHALAVDVDQPACGPAARG